MAHDPAAACVEPLVAPPLDARSLDAATPHAPPDIVYTDAHCLVVVKPPGLLAVTGRGAAGADCLAARLQAIDPAIRVVHRLDMATSGLMVFARDALSQRRLGDAFARRAIAKTYVAVVAGRLADDAGEIALPLAADWPRRPRQKVDALHGKPASTHYRVLARTPDGTSTRVELRPVTGRSHQLRVHLLALGHPILGDALYGDAEVQRAAGRLLLHATALDFAHPADERRIACASAVPF